ncbi:ribosomal protein L10e/L16 [Apiospora hydei]|uniref:Ribosomal protein L10e/L16 n=1 Tax=Apiospora hydei TaxID=1337664 RepID=A0ABR1XD92_9PEZI
MRPNNTLSLAGALKGLSISASSSTVRPSLGPAAALAIASSQPQTQRKTPSNVRLFSVTASRAGNWLEPNIKRTQKMMKGGPAWPRLKIAEDAIKLRLRGEKYRLYKRVCCNIGVFTSGNEMRMGKGKGGFDHWAARVAVNQIVLELKGMLHEQVARDAFRLAGNKLPGQWEFVKKGEPPVVGITKLDGVTLEELKRPRRKVAAETILPATPAPAAEAAQQPLDNP